MRDPFATRRDFLLSAGVFAAGAVVARPPARAAAPSLDDDDDDVPAQVAPGAEAADRRAVAPATIAEAEKLAGINFTDAERETMSRTIGEQVAMLANRRALGWLPNDLAPAMTFDPRLPDMTFPLAIGAFVRLHDDPGPVPDDDDDLAFAPVTKLSRWIERGTLTSTHLTHVYLGRIKRVDPRIKAVITLTEDHALRQAARADDEIARGNYRGPLHGIPYGAKDLLDTRGIRTTWGAEPYVDRVPNGDAAVIRKLDEAGAVLLAKLSLGALAYNDIWFGGRTNNPWNLEQGSSGSSAGSAAATVAGLVGFSIGTETYGSIVSPCMRCGATGLRPTFGRVSRAGAMALCWSLDKIGPICRTAEDCMIVLNAIAGHDPADASSTMMPLPFDANHSRDLRGMRIGYHPSWFERAHPLDRAALDHARNLGAEMVEIDLPDWPYNSLLTILFCEAAAAFEELTRTDLDDTLTWQEPRAWPNTFRQSWFIPGIELVQADRFRRMCMRMMAERFEQVEAILAPSFAASLLLITNNTGHPSLTIRSGFRDNGSPHGITMIGRLYDEGRLCALGMALEREFDCRHRRPEL